jgi:hypothetical protein
MIEIVYIVILLALASVLIYAAVSLYHNLRGFGGSRIDRFLVAVLAVLGFGLAVTGVLMFVAHVMSPISILIR